MLSYKLQEDRRKKRKKKYGKEKSVWIKPKFGMLKCLHYMFWGRNFFHKKHILSICTAKCSLHDYSNYLHEKYILMLVIINPVPNVLSLYQRCKYWNRSSERTKNTVNVFMYQMLIIQKGQTMGSPDRKSCTNHNFCSFIQGRLQN